MKTFLKVLPAAAFLLLAGCRAATVGSFEQRRIIGISSANFGEYVIPVISIGEGPSAYVFQSRDRPSRVRVEGHATTTNTTSALGIYSSTEEKHFDFTGTFEVLSTNDVDTTGAEAPNEPIEMGAPESK